MVAKISYRDFRHGCSVSRVRQSCLPKRRREQDKGKETETEAAAKWQWHDRPVRVLVTWLSHSRRSESCGAMGFEPTTSCKPFQINVPLSMPDVLSWLAIRLECEAR